MNESESPLQHNETPPTPERRLSEAEKNNLVAQVNQLRTPEEKDSFPKNPTKRRRFKLPEMLRKHSPKLPERITQLVPGQDRQRVFLPGFGCIQVSAIGMVDKDGTISSEDPFTKLVLRLGFSQKDKETLLNYYQNGGLIVLMRTEKPPRGFRVALSEHARRFYGGIVSLAEAIVIMRGLALGENLSGNQKASSPDSTPQGINQDVSQEAHAPDSGKNSDEDTSLRNLVELANGGRSIRFAAITPQDGHMPEDVQNVIDSMNSKIAPLEFIYATLSASTEKVRDSQKESLMLLGLSVFMPTALQKAVSQFGHTAEMLAGSLVGDLVTGIMAGKGVERRKAKMFEMRKSLIKIIERVRKDSQLRHRVFASGAVLGTTLTAMLLSAAIGGALPLPFLLASPINSAIITLTEWHKRKTANPKTEEETAMMLQSTDKRHVLSRLSRILAPSAKSTLAWRDLMKNRTYMGELAGSIASVPLLLFLNAMFPAAIPFSVLVVLSTLVFEKMGGVIAGASSLHRDMWKTFEGNLPKVENLIKTVQAQQSTSQQ